MFQGGIECLNMHKGELSNFFPLDCVSLTVCDMNSLMTNIKIINVGYVYWLMNIQPKN